MMKRTAVPSGFKGKPAIAAAALLLATTAALAQTRYQPAPEAVVLPRSAHAEGGVQALREAGAAWRREPADEAAALAYAREAFVLGLSEGDLRWYGAARRALQPWWDAERLNAPMHFMRALVRQGYHDFRGALTDLDAAIALDPGRAEFWSWRFSLHLLTTQLQAARADCAQIDARFGADEGAACAAILQVRTGQAGAAVPVLARLSELPDYQGPLAQDWLRYHQGEALRVAGRAQEAVAVWQAYLQARPRAHLVRSALAELLNALGRHAEALRISLLERVPADALLVQAVIASRALQDPRAAALDDQALQRLQAQDARGEALIERPQMMYWIRTGRDVARGLELAERNWRDQQEPADAVLLAEAALARGQPARAAPVLDWLAATGYTDPALDPLAAQLRQRLGR